MHVKPGQSQHLPARDLLTHTGVLDVAAPKKEAADHIVIQIGGLSDADFVPDEAPETDPAPQQISAMPPGDDVILEKEQ